MKKLLLTLILGLLVSNLFAQSIPICPVDSGTNPFRQMNGCKWFNSPIGILSDPLKNFIVGGKVRTFVGQNFQYGVSPVLITDSDFVFQAGNIDGRFGNGTSIQLSDSKKKITLGTRNASSLLIGGANGDFGETWMGDVQGFGHGTMLRIRDSSIYKYIDFTTDGVVTKFDGLGITNAIFATNGGPLFTDGTGNFKQSPAGTSTQVYHGGTIHSFSSVALADMATMATASVFYRKTAGTGVPEVQSLATLKADLGLTGTNSGDVTKSGENYITLTGQALTVNAVNLAGTNVTGTLHAASVDQDSSQWSMDGSGNIQPKNTGTVNIPNDLNEGGVSNFTSDVTVSGYFSVGTFDATGAGTFHDALQFSNYVTNGGILTTDGSGNLVQLATDAHSYLVLRADNTFGTLNLSAASVSGILTPSFGGTGVSNTGTITLGSSFITTGAGTPTLAFPSSNFTYTYPLSSSTLLANNLGLSGGTTLIGGTATTDALKLRSTSGVGTTGADIIFQTGNNGAIEVGRFLNAGQFGVGVSSPTAMLHLKAGTATASTAPLKFNSGTNLTSPEAGAMEFDGTNLYFSPSTTRYRVMGIGTPSIAAGVGAGTSPTVSVAGNDGAMTVSVTTGTLPTGTNAVVATVTFNKAWGSTPRVVFSPANAITATLSGVSMVFMDAAASTTTYVITSGTTALTAATAYKWNVHAAQ